MFKWFGIDGYIQKTVANEAFLYLLLAATTFGFITAFAFLIVNGQNMGNFATLGVVFSIAIVVQIVVLLNSRKLLYSLTFNTFDFWFILWNAINVVISRATLGMFCHRFVWYSILRTLASFFTATTLVCMDASHISKRAKIVCRSSVVMYFSFLGLSFYFSGKDVQWNPFESYGIKESNISFKSVYVFIVID